jgi:hypothetical protein
MIMDTRSIGEKKDIPDFTADNPAMEKKRSSARNKYLILFISGIILLALILIISFVLKDKTNSSNTQTAEADSLPSATPQITNETPVSSQPENALQTPGPKTELEKKTVAEALKNTGQDSEGEYIVYSVVFGDTLSNIAFKFTGTGYNYPKIAAENAIANPDLIFPDQKIKIYKK